MLISRGIRPFIRACRDRTCFQNVAVKSPTTLGKIECSALLVRTFSAPKKAVEKVIILKNNAIKCPIIRVVYDDKDTGKSVHAIMLRNEALDFAAEKKLDLILGNFVVTHPSFCRNLIIHWHTSTIL